jgi:hypothetical protein
MKKISQVLRKVLLLDEFWNHEARRTALAIGANRVGLPERSFSANENDATKDIEPKRWHEVASAQWAPRTAEDERASSTTFFACLRSAPDSLRYTRIASISLPARASSMTSADGSSELHGRHRTWLGRTPTYR